MKKLLCILFLAIPIGTYADHLDVIEVQLNDGCTLATFLAIKDDFNKQWAAKYNYQAEVLVPIQSHNLVAIYWVGRAANAAAFGRAWDQWNADLMDPNSVGAKLWARFLECSTNMSRRGYDTY